MEQKTNGPQQPDLPGLARVKAFGESKVVVNQAREENSRVAKPAEKSPERASLHHQVEVVFRAPVDNRAGLRHALLPKLVGKRLQSRPIVAGESCGGQRRTTRIEALRHHRAKGHKVGDFSVAPRTAAGTGQWKLLKSKGEIEDVAEPFEAVAGAVKAKKEQFVRGRQKPGRDSLKVRETDPLPGALHIEVEGQRMLDVVMQIHRDSVTPPGPLMIVAAAPGQEAELGEQIFRARHIHRADQQVEVAARSQCCIAAEPFGHPGTLERNDGNAALMKGRKDAPERRGPEEGGNLHVAVNLAQSRIKTWGNGAWNRAQPCRRLGQNVFPFREIKDGEPLCFGAIAGSRLSAQQGKQEMHSRSHAGAPPADRAAMRDCAAGTASPRKVFQTAAFCTVVETVARTRAGVRCTGTV